MLPICHIDFKHLMLNIKAIKRVHRVEKRPSNLPSEMEAASVIFDDNGFEGRKPRTMSKLRGGNSEASESVQNRYPNTTAILSLLRYRILSQFVPTSKIQILCRYELKKKNTETELFLFHL